MCAAQPVILDITKIGVKKAVDESLRDNSYNLKIVANRFACLTKK